MSIRPGLAPSTSMHVGMKSTSISLSVVELRLLVFHCAAA